MDWSFGLYGSGMHDFVLRELEVGFRVAAAEDSEACGFGPMIDASYAEYMRQFEVPKPGPCAIACQA